MKVEASLLQEADDRTGRDGFLPPWEGNHGSPLLGLPGNRSKMAKAEFAMELNNSEW